MRLRLVLPTHVLIDREVRSVSAEGIEGSFTLKPRHVDYVAALRPGILIFRGEDGHEHFAAVDAGVLVKSGAEVVVSTPAAVEGEHLGELRRVIDERFATQDEKQRETRTAISKLEAGFVRRFLELQHHV